jgi:hypothetical protein
LDQSFADLLILPSLQTNCVPSKCDIPTFLPEQGLPPAIDIKGSNRRIRANLMVKCDSLSHMKYS